MYQGLFFGYCLSFNTFGNKVVSCRYYGRNDFMRDDSKRYHKSRIFHGPTDRNNNKDPNILEEKYLLIIL